MAPLPITYGLTAVGKLKEIKTHFAL